MKKKVPWNKKTNKVARSKSAGEARAAERKKKEAKKNKEKQFMSKVVGGDRAFKRKKKEWKRVLAQSEDKERAIRKTRLHGG